MVVDNFADRKVSERSRTTDFFPLVTFRFAAGFAGEDIWLSALFRFAVWFVEGVKEPTRGPLVARVGDRGSPRAITTLRFFLALQLRISFGQSYV